MLTPFVAFFVLQTTPVSAEAKALGRRLAAAGTLAGLVPLIVEKDIGELAKEDDSLTAAERERLLTIGREQGAAGREKLIAAMGSAYASRLSAADLRILVEQAETPAAGALRTVQPQVIIDTMTALGNIDLKKEVAAAMCRDTGKLCDRD